MEKIDTDYKQRNLKSLAKLFKTFNRDCAPLNLNNILLLILILQCYYLNRVCLDKSKLHLRVHPLNPLS